MVDTQREEQKTLEQLIIKNCKSKHSGETLPDNPWFIREARNERVGSVLKKILFESQKQVSTFSRNAAKAILMYSEAKNSHEASQASNLRENVDLRNIHKEVEESKIQTETSILIAVFKAQSRTYGPVTVKFDYEGESISLEERDKKKFPGRLNDSVKLEFYVDDYGNTKKIDDKLIHFQEAIQDIKYTNITKKEEFSDTLKIEKPDFNVILELQVVLSKSDKLNILKSYLIENEKQLHISNEEAETYPYLIDALGIVEENNQYESLIVPKYSREDSGFCNSCLLI